VGAKVDRLGAQFAEVGQERLAVLHVGVIRFVGAEEAPDGFQLALVNGTVHPD
jgi:hypothetical protein